MSRYVNALGRALAEALKQVPAAQPSQVAGYWANREFWLDEFRHLLDAADGYARRLGRMKAAQQEYLRRHGDREGNRDEFGVPRQRVRDTVGPPRRRSAAAEARAAIKALAERALNLQLASFAEYEAFVRQLRIEGRDESA